MPQTYDPRYAQLFLQDIGAPVNANNLSFVNQWEHAEGVGQQALQGYNYLATTQSMPGSQGIPGSNNGAGNIMTYPSIQEGAQAAATALQENFRGYPQLLQELRAGTTPYGQMAGTLNQSQWGTHDMPNAVTTGVAVGPDGSLVSTATNNIINAPAADAINQSQNYNALGIANSSLLAQQNAGYAQQETGFQQALLGLSKQGLGVELGALARQETLDPKLRALQLQQFGLQSQAIGRARSDIERQGKANIAGTQSGQAASGNLFTSGGRTGLANVRADLASALASNTAQAQGLHISEEQATMGYKEQLAALKDQEKNIAIQAQRYGISGEELQARLQNALQNINAGNIQTILGFQQQGISNIAQLSALYGQGLPLGATIGGVGNP